MIDHDSKPTILVVEDDASLCRLVVRFLHAAGFATLAAGRAADGLALVRQHQGAFDLAIVDMVMPGMSGLDLATDLDREYRLHRQPRGRCAFPAVPRPCTAEAVQ
jgi:DNA-binding response OmpR family regulator